MTNTAPSPLPYLLSLTRLSERGDPPYSVFVTQEPTSSSILNSITIVSLITYCCLPCCALATGTKENNVFYFLYILPTNIENHLGDHGKVLSWNISLGFTQTLHYVCSGRNGFNDSGAMIHCRESM